jgi:hypothetical protein
MYLLDANIFLELLLDQKNADDCTLFLKKIKEEKAEGLISDFHLDTILVIMEHHKSPPEDMRKFIIAVNTLKGLRIYHLTLSDRIEATRHIEKFSLKYDDALAVQVMKSFKIKQIVSYDKHFDMIPNIKRVEPINITFE